MIVSPLAWGDLSAGLSEHGLNSYSLVRGGDSTACSQWHRQQAVGIEQLNAG
ncbi:MAG: hypothetical protein HXY51_04265 [Nitrospirae bacterium]|nr:hypothetical protein [Nitrospirota bacterium]